MAPSPSTFALKAVRPIRLPTPMATVELLRCGVPAVLAVHAVGSKARRGVVLVAAGTVDEYQIITSDNMSPTAKLMDVMSRPVQVATPDQRLSEIDAFFAAHSGLPVVDNEGRCIGVVSKKDMARATNGMDSTVGEVMSSPAITLTHQKTIFEAAALMLKENVHMIPVVNEQHYVIGIVTGTDVFQALEANKP